MFEKLFGKVNIAPQILLNDAIKLEKVARKLCQLRNLNPDHSELILENGTPVITPVWKIQQKELVAYLQILVAIESL